MSLLKRKVSRMANRFSGRRTGNIFSFTWKAGILLFFLGMPLSSCTIIGVNCIGSNVTCNTGAPSPTPDRPAIVATAHAITQSKPLMSDPMNKPDSNRWGNHAGCTFRNGAYVVTYNGTPSTYGCDATRLHYSDAAIQMDVTLISGDSAGIIFRVSPSFSEMYDFEITNQGQFGLLLFNKNGTTTLIPATASSAIHGIGKKNTLLVIAKGNNFQLLINGVFAGETHDNSLTTGYVGASVADYSSNAQASFSNLVIYQV